MIYKLLKGDISQEEVLNYYNASITYMRLPKFINGFVFQYKSYNNIFINYSMSIEKKRNTILHELAHIELAQLEQSDNDLFAFKTIKYEDEADRYLKFILEGIENEKQNTQIFN